MPCWWESINLDGSCLPHLLCSQLGETGCVGCLDSVPVEAPGLHQHLGGASEAVPQESVGAFPVLMLGDPTPEWETGKAGLACRKLPEAER